MSEVLFGIIMVLTFTGSLRVADAGREDLRAVLVGALGCNFAWGLVDAVMYLMAAFMTRARQRVAFARIRQTHDPDAAHRAVADLLPAGVSSALTSAEIELLRQRLSQQDVTSADARFDRMRLHAKSRIAIWRMSSSCAEYSRRFGTSQLTGDSNFGIPGCRVEVECG